MWDGACWLPVVSLIPSRICLPGLWAEFQMTGKICKGPLRLRFKLALPHFYCHGPPTASSRSRRGRWTPPVNRDAAESQSKGLVGAGGFICNEPQGIKHTTVKIFQNASHFITISNKQRFTCKPLQERQEKLDVQAFMPVTTIRNSDGVEPACKLTHRNSTGCSWSSPTICLEKEFKPERNDRDGQGGGGLIEDYIHFQ